MASGLVMEVTSGGGEVMGDGGLFVNSKYAKAAEHSAAEHSALRRLKLT